MAKTKTKKRHYVLYEGKKETNHVFSGRFPKYGAMKAVNKGFTSFGLRERGNKKVHMYEGKIEWIPAPEKLPEWIKPKDGKIKKAIVKKVGLIKIQ